MNILLFVTAMLLILSLMTFARIDSFRLSTALESEFQRYIGEVEHSYEDKAAEKWYDTTISKKRSDENEKAHISKSSSRLNFLLLLDPELQKNNPEIYAEAVQWIKRLMFNLYGRALFFQKALEKDPNFLDHLLESIAFSYQELAPNLRPKRSAAKLSNLTLTDPDMENAFYLMLKGCQGKIDTNPTTISRAFRGVGEEEEEDAANIAMEYRAEKKFSSLLNYITLSTTATKVRVYLASRLLLNAIFGDPEVADALIIKREELFNALIAGMPASEATQHLETAFQSYFPEGEGIDYTVTKTNPMRYN